MAPLVLLAHSASLPLPEPGRVFSAAELARLARINSAGRRAEFIGGHWLLRLLLAHRLGGQPADYELQQSAGSPPHLPARPELRLGLSHSQGWLAAAVMRGEEGQQLGLDIELERPRKNLPALARYSFGEQWPESQGSDLAPAFFRRWTQCEALVKGSQYSLGTRLLRGACFDAGAPPADGLQVRHACCQLAGATLHLAVCSPPAPSPQLLCYGDGELTPMAAAFTTYAVTVCPGT